MGLKDFIVTDQPDLTQQIIQLLRDCLQLGSRAEQFDANSGLLGQVPELDSMAVVTVLNGIEERFDIFIEDDEISAETFETVGTLTDFVAGKIAQ